MSTYNERALHEALAGRPLPPRGRWRESAVVGWSLVALVYIAPGLYVALDLLVF